MAGSLKFRASPLNLSLMAFTAIIYNNSHIDSKIFFVFQNSKHPKFVVQLVLILNSATQWNERFYLYEHNLHNYNSDKMKILSSSIKLLCCFIFKLFCYLFANSFQLSIFCLAIFLKWNFFLEKNFWLKNPSVRYKNVVMPKQMLRIFIGFLIIIILI